MFPDTRPDRQIISSNSAEGTFLEHRQFLDKLHTKCDRSTTVTDTKSVGGGGGPGSGLNQPPAPDFDPIQLPDSGDGVTNALRFTTPTPTGIFRRCFSVNSSSRSRRKIFTLFQQSPQFVVDDHPLLFHSFVLI